MEKRASRRFTAIIFTATALMMLFAWVHSCFPGNVSAQESLGFLRMFYRLFELFGLDRETAHGIIRKLAHFSEFAVIGGLLMSCAYCFDRLKPYRFTVPVLFTALMTALIDETIQLFSEGRAGMITDVWIDLSGAVTGSLLLLVFYTLYRRLKCRRLQALGGEKDG